MLPRWIVPLVIATVVAVPVAADWPQFRGAARMGATAGDGLAPEWPPSGPPELWRRPIGAGYSGVAVVDGLACTMATAENVADPTAEAGPRSAEEEVICFEAASGRTAWRTPVGPGRRSDLDDSGPRATPTIDGDRLFAVSSAGLLVALSIADGSELWRRQLMPIDQAPRFGYAVSPLVTDGMVIVEAGAADDDAGVVALDRESGEVRWTALAGPAGYGSPVVVELGGERQLLLFRRVGAEVVSLSLDGDVLWRHPTAGLAIIVSPLYLEPGRVFVASADDAFGGLMLAVDRTDDGYRVRELWSQRRMRNHFNGSVAVAGHLYGFDNGTLRCLDAASGAFRWARRGLGKGSLLAAGELLYVLGDDGTLVVGKATPDGFEEKGRVQATTGRAWTAPSLASGRLYVRDFDEIVAFDVRADSGRGGAR